MSQENADIALRQIERSTGEMRTRLSLASPNVEWEDSMSWTEPARTYRGRAGSWVDQRIHWSRGSASASGPRDRLNRDGRVSAV